MVQEVILSSKEIENIYDIYFREGWIKEHVDNQFIFVLMYSNVRPIEFSLTTINNSASLKKPHYKTFISFRDSSKPLHRTNRHDIKVGMAAAKKCVEIQKILEQKFKHTGYNSTELEGYVKYFLQNQKKIQLIELLRAIGEFKKMTIG